MSKLRGLFGQEPIVGSPKNTEIPPHTFPELSGVDRGEARHHLARSAYKAHRQTSGVWFWVGFFVFVGVTVALTFGNVGSYIQMMCVNPFIGFLASVPFFAMTGARSVAGR